MNALALMLTLLAQPVSSGRPGTTPAKIAPSAAPSAAQLWRELPDQASVVFLGDSITQQHLYTALIESYFERKQPRRALRFYNRGLRGDTAASARKRLHRDLTPLKPDLVLVALGMNDGGYRGYQRGLLQTFARELEGLVDAIQTQHRARVVLLTPTAVREEGPRLRDYNRMLAAIAQVTRDLGASQGVPVIEVFAFFREGMARARDSNPPIELMLDAIHPGPAGHLLIAHQLLSALEPAPVSRHESWRLSPEDRKAGTVERALVHPMDGLYLPPAMRPAAALVSWQQRCNSQVLKVEGIASRARLQIAGVSVGTYSVQQLNRGIDLGLVDGLPWSIQARKTYQLIQERWFWTYLLWDPEELGVEAASVVALAAPAQYAHRSPRNEQARQELQRVERLLVEQRTQGRKPYRVRLEQVR